ncbi:MAG TPA: trypsin-like peptidase domain-containing protein [Candidatus Saccharimonadales bacterium]|nr:trypsin-like peptidase domain-containing protein [Candidatus Saccharimonadales bacterium]
MEEKSEDSPSPVRTRRNAQVKKPSLRSLALIFFVFVAGFLGAWGAIESGFIKASNKTITQNRETVVTQEGEVIADVANKVSPSVVSVNTTQTSAGGVFGQAVESQGAGTGIIVSSDGYVLTNKHVIPDGTDKVQIVTANGTTYDNVQVIGRDPSNDIAFLKIQGVKDLTAAKLGDSDSVRVGQKVIAIGNALGQFQNTVTQGIISGKGRPLQASDSSDSQSTESLSNLFQTDAAINPGNSGGPLLNINGEVIGINTAVAEQAQGIGFALPINDAKGLLQGVLSQGKVVKAFLGVQYIMLTPATSKQVNADLDHGALVYAGTGNPIVAGSPAEKAGLKRGDIITQVNGKDVNENAPLASRLGQFQPGDQVSLTVHRDGKDQTIKVTLEEYR